MAFAMILALATIFVILLSTRRIVSSALGLDGPQFSSLFQGATRWHTFIAFAIIPVLFGREALPLGAIAAAAMTPLLNVANVAVVSLCAAGRLPPPTTVDLAILRNPFFLSSIAGVAYKVTGLSFPALAGVTFDMVGRGSLGLALLTAGAGLRLNENATQAMPVALATFLKLVAMPFFAWGWLAALGVIGIPAAVAVICTGVPTGAGAYVLARHLGGDAPLVASIMTVQVICAAITLPAALYLLGYQP